MAITGVGTPSPQQATGSGSPASLAGVWGTGQNRTAPNLLVALVTAAGTTSAAATAQHSGTTGWTKIFEGGGTFVKAAIWTKPATGGDAAPSFDSTIAGTSARCRMSVTLYEVTDSGGTTPALDTGSQDTGTSASPLPCVSDANVTAAGEFALAVQCILGTTSGANTWGAVTGWTNSFNDGATTYNHWVAAETSTAPASGAALTYNPTHSYTTTGTGGALAVFKPGALNANAAPAVLAVPAAFPVPTVRQDQAVSPAKLSAPAAFPAVTASGGGGAATYDAVGPSASGQQWAGGATSWTHTVATGPAALLVWVVNDTPDPASKVCNLDGSPMTLLQDQVHVDANGTLGGLLLFGKANVAAGAHTVAPNVTGVGSVEGGSVSVSAADTTAPFGAPSAATSSGTSTPATTGSVTVPATSLIVGGSASGGTLDPASSPATNRITCNRDSSGTCRNLGVATRPGTGSAATISFPISSGADFWAAVAIEVKGASGDATATPARLLAPAAFPAPGVVTPDATASPARLLAPAAFPAPHVGLELYIAGLGGTGAGYFADQNGQPRFLLGDEAWGLLANAGAWSGGDWQGTISSYLSARAGQGFTSMVVSAVSFDLAGCVNVNGDDWDNVRPWVTAGDPSSGLNEAFWVRRDYLITTARQYDITVVMNPIFNLAFDTANGAFNGKTAQQFTDYGTNLGNRYKTGFPNLMWLVGDDYFGGAFDTNLSAWRTALRATGDAHALSIQNYQETTARKDLFDGSSLPWGSSNAEFNWVYSYNVAYDGIEKAHLEASPLPLGRGDGGFIVANDAADALLQRSHAWWALSSGARGYNTGSENVWRWTAGAAAAVTSDVFFGDGTAGHIRSVFENLQGWHLLIPDTSSLLVTGGRGTHRSAIVSGGGGTAYTGTSDAYVTASRVPDGTLAVIYMSHATTITIDQTKMAAGYGAKWYDPVSGAVQSATPGSTYNSAPLGNNSAGNPDWVLVLQGPPVAGNATATPGVLPAPAAFPAPVVRQDQVTAPAKLGVPAAFPAVTVRQDQLVAPARLSAPASFPAPVVSRPPMDILADSFTGTTLDTGKWTESTAGGAAAPALSYSSTGALLTYAAVSTASSLGQIISAGLYNLTGSYALAEVTSVPTSATQADAALQLQQPGDATHQFHWVKEGGTLYAQYTNGGAQVNYFQIAYSAADHRWWRIRESGGTIYWDTAPDGIAWVNRASIAAPFAVTSLQILFLGSCWENETSPGTFGWRNFNSVPAASAFLLVPVAFPAVTVRQDQATAPAVLAAPAAFPAVTARQDQLTAPARLAAPATFPAVIVRQDQSASPAVLAAPAAFPAPVVTAGGSATATPAVLAAPASFPGGMIVRQDQTATPAVLAALAAFPVVTTSGGARSSPGVLAAPASFPVPVVRQDAALGSAVLTAPVSFPAATVTAGGSAVVTPVALAVPAAFPVPVVRQDQLAAPARLLTPAAFPAPSVSAGGGAAVSAAALACPAAFPAVTVRQDQSAAPVVLAAPAAFPLSSVSGSGTATVAAVVLACPVAFPPPVVRQDQAPSTAVLAAPVTFGVVVVRQDHTVTMTVFARSVTFPAVAAGAGAGPSPATLTATAVFPAPSMHTSMTVAPLALMLTVNLGGGTVRYVPKTIDLKGLAAGPPHGRWSVTAPHGRYDAGEPHGRWAAGPPHS